MIVGRVPAFAVLDLSCQVGGLALPGRQHRRQLALRGGGAGPPERTGQPWQHRLLAEGWVPQPTSIQVQLFTVVDTLGLAVAFGVYALIDGAGRIIDAFGDGGRYHRVAHLLSGLLGLAAGIVTIVWPAITVLALALLVGAWALVTGVSEIAAAIRLRNLAPTQQ